MTTERTLTWSIPGTPEQILRRCQDPEVARRRAEIDPALEAQVTELAADTDDGHILVMEITAKIPESWIPKRFSASLRGMAGRPRIVRREAWRLADDGCAHADIDVRLESIPATRINASARLCDDDADHSTLTYHLELEVAIPLMGATIERTVLDQVARGYDKEVRVLQGAGGGRS